jgi:hypothetical protein
MRRVIRVVVGLVLADVKQSSQPQADVVEGSHPGVELLLRKLRRISGIGKGVEGKGPAPVELGPNKAAVLLLRRLVVCVSRWEKTPEGGVFRVRGYGSAQLSRQRPEQVAVLGAESYFVAPRAGAP